jgi:hypothetical protein
MLARISLVFPLTEERGLTVEALKAWTSQSMAAKRFEVIVVADERTHLDPRIPSLLRPHDHIVRGALANHAHQFDTGVRAGTGEYLLLTESHCMPDPDCLEAMDRFLAANPHLAGACCESVPAWESAYQLIDATTFEEGYRHFLRTDDWRKFSVHGLAIRRGLYLELGGLQHQYGRFAEMLLAAAIRDAGHKLGYARDSVVTHHYRETLQEIIDGTDDYVASECIYRAANPGPDRVGHSYLPTAPNPFSPGAVALNREVAVALLSGAVGRNTGAMREAFLAAVRSLTGLLGRRGPVLSARLALAACRLLCWWNRHDPARVDVPYRKLIRLASDLSCARFHAAHNTADDPLPEASPSIAIDRLPEWALYGFHGLERMNGLPFRWTGRVAAMQFPLLKGQYRVRLVTRGVRNWRVNLRAAFNGTPIAPIAAAGGDYELRVEPWHCHAREQTLILAADPLCPWRHGVKDYRELGLTLFAIEATPTAGQTGTRLRKSA